VVVPSNFPERPIFALRKQAQMEPAWLKTPISHFAHAGHGNAPHCGSHPRPKVNSVATALRKPDSLPILR